MNEKAYEIALLESIAKKLKTLESEIKKLREEVRRPSIVVPFEERIGTTIKKIKISPPARKIGMYNKGPDTAYVRINDAIRDPVRLEPYVYKDYELEKIQFLYVNSSGNCVIEFEVFR